MAIRMRYLICLFLFLQYPLFSIADEELAAAESTGEPEKEEGWVTEQMRVTYHNIQVPRAMWDNIKEILKKDKVDEKTIEEFSVQPISVNVELASDDEFVLKDRLNYRLQYSEGGGDLDLFNYVTGKGPLNIRFAPHLTDGQKFHMLYISDSPKKDVDGVVWGNSCGKIYNLSESAGKFLLDPGMRMTSSRRHYLHLMAGTFIFFQLIDDKLLLGYIRVMDSRYPQFNCRNAG